MHGAQQAGLPDGGDGVRRHHHVGLDRDVYRTPLRVVDRTGTVPTLPTTTSLIRTANSTPALRHWRVRRGKWRRLVLVPRLRAAGANSNPRTHSLSATARRSTPSIVNRLTLRIMTAAPLPQATVGHWVLPVCGSGRSRRRSAAVRPARLTARAADLGSAAPGKSAGDGVAGASLSGMYRPGGPGGLVQPGGGGMSPAPVKAETVGGGSGGSPGPAPPGASFGSVSVSRSGLIAGLEVRVDRQRNVVDVQ